MSYSRWSNSHWYTYWSTTSDPNINGRQIMTFCSAGENGEPIDFTYSELAASTDIALDRLRREHPNATEEEYAEAKELFAAFIWDVEFERKLREPAKQPAGA